MRSHKVLYAPDWAPHGWAVMLKDYFIKAAHASIKPSKKEDAIRAGLIDALWASSCTDKEDMDEYALTISNRMVPA